MGSKLSVFLDLVKVKNTRPKGNVFWKFIESRDYINTHTHTHTHTENPLFKGGGEKERAGGVLTINAYYYYYYYYYWENQFHCSGIRPSSTGRLETR